MSRDATKVAGVRQILTELGDPEFWTSEQMDTALNAIDSIIDPERELTGVFYHTGGSITDDGQNVVDPGWYFWDESGLFIGGYETFERVLIAQQEYVEYLR
jgi:hypothetical protein